MALFGGRKEDRGLKGGFRDMKWGDAPRPGMTVLEETGNDRHCMLEGDDLEFGGATVGRIVYAYFQKRLAGVHLEIPPESVDAVFRHLTAEWGKPEQPNRFIEDYNWKNDKQGVEGTVASFSRNPNTKAATLDIQSRYILAKRTLVPGAPPPTP